jgi:hypothetical protein
MTLRILRHARETTIEARVVRDVRTKHGVFSIKMTVGDGWPDRLFILKDGRTFWIEFKAPGGELKGKQTLKASLLRELGHDVEVHDNYPDAMEAIERRILKSAQKERMAAERDCDADRAP